MKTNLFTALLALSLFDILSMEAAAPGRNRHERERLEQATVQKLERTRPEPGGGRRVSRILHDRGGLGNITTIETLDADGEVVDL
jgi:hypothetical protein